MSSITTRATMREVIKPPEMLDSYYRPKCAPREVKEGSFP
jgi:hypothetical protein